MQPIERVLFVVLAVGFASINAALADGGTRKYWTHQLLVSATAGDYHAHLDPEAVYNLLAEMKELGLEEETNQYPFINYETLERYLSVAKADQCQEMHLMSELTSQAREQQKTKNLVPYLEYHHERLSKNCGCFAGGNNS